MRTQKLTPVLHVLMVLGIFAGGVGTPAEAAAKKRVVILPFTGPQGGAARNGVARSLNRRATLLNPKLYIRNVRKLGVDGGEPEGITAVCRRLKCDSVIRGEVKRRGRRYTLTVTVYNAETGEAVARRAATVRGRRRLVRAGRAIGGKLAPVLRKTSRPTGAAPRPVEPPTPAPPPIDPSPAPTAQNPDRGGDISDIPLYQPQGDAATDSEDATIEESTERGSMADLVDVSLSLGISSRNGKLTAATPENNGSYDGGMFPEFTLRADVYPMAPFVRSFFRNIGLGATYTRHITINTKDTETAGDDTSVDTTSQELLIDLKVRWPLFSSPTTPVVTLFGGYGLRDFNLGANTVLTSFNYRFARFGAEGIIPFGTPLAAAFVGADARPVFSTGAQTKESYGELDSAFGFAARVGFCGEHSSGLIYFLGFEYLQFSASYVGVDSNLAPLAEWPNVFEPSESSDRFIRFWAGAGYSM